MHTFSSSLLIASIISFLPLSGKAEGTASPTEGVLTHNFVNESVMQSDLLQMLANSLTYASNIWYDCTAANSAGEQCGYFKANSAGNSNEDGVRTNADFSMICAFLFKYAQNKVILPAGLTWDKVKLMAVRSLVFGYSTHKANKLKVTSNNAYWGSTSTTDYTWESSLWTMSLAYSSYFLGDELTQAQKDYVRNMIKAECNYELGRTVPTGYSGDTKAEENGWEADILACALGLYPNDDLAPKWFARLRQFAINSYSQIDDATDATVVDPVYDATTVKDLYIGQNLYNDYTLQNHNYFHTSYQNVVMQELGEAYLAMALFQGSTPKWKTNALLHNSQKVMDLVLNELALSDGELAMPNGNDWSMFLYDQITSYTTAACFLRDPNALMLENMAYKNIKARQTTTSDGSWLLNSDIGPRRMGVEGHRVMMTWLMHNMASTANLTPTAWDDFNAAHQQAHVFTSQNIVRAASADRFVCFSWCAGLSSYTGYIASNSADKNKIIVPYKANNTGNILGYYTVDGKATNATAVTAGVYRLLGNSFVMNGTLNTNAASLKVSFSLYATPANAVIYLDNVKALTDCNITKERGGLMAISTDPFTSTTRTLHFPGGTRTVDGTSLNNFAGSWVNIDNAVGIVTSRANNQMAFGDQAITNSIKTSKIYPLFSNVSRTCTAGSSVDRRDVVYYSNISAETTEQMHQGLQSLTTFVPDEWNGIIVPDPDGGRYLLLSNFGGKSNAMLSGIKCPVGAPVFSVPTTISSGASSATFRCIAGSSIANTLRFYVTSGNIVAQQSPSDSISAYLTSSQQTATVGVAILSGGSTFVGTVTVPAGTTMLVRLVDGMIVAEKAKLPDFGSNSLLGFNDVTARYIENPSFEADATYGTLNTAGVKAGNVNYNPCYTNSIVASDTRWPNILPVSGWTTDNGLDQGSNYARMYSMPYSESVSCVSPSAIGNYAARCDIPLEDDSCGLRCLTVLCSWAKGINRITQTATLPEGTYRLVFDARMECPSVASQTANTIVIGNNVNSSYCGVSYGNVTYYRYPEQAAVWDTLQYDFTLSDTMSVAFSLGYGTSDAIGAASNTLLYIDNMRLYARHNTPTALVTPECSRLANTCDVYTLDGRKVASRSVGNDTSCSLPKGIYVFGHRKQIMNGF